MINERYFTVCSELVLIFEELRADHFNLRFDGE